MEQQRFKISVDDECIYCRSRDSIHTLFWSALVASFFRKRRYGWFNDKHKVKLNLSSLQLVFKDYKPPSKVLVKT